MVRVFYRVTAEKDIRFAIPLSGYIIRSGFPFPHNKRAIIKKSKLFESTLVEANITKCSYTSNRSYFEITREELIRWIRGIRINQVRNITDLEILQRIEKDYGKGMV